VDDLSLKSRHLIDCADVLSRLCAGRVAARVSSAYHLALVGYGGLVGGTRWATERTSLNKNKYEPEPGPDAEVPPFPPAPSLSAADRLRAEGKTSPLAKLSQTPDV